MVLAVALGLLTLALAIRLVLGPDRWQRLARDGHRADPAPPAGRRVGVGPALDALVLVVVGTACVQATTDAVARLRTDTRLLDATSTAVDLVPGNEIDPTRLRTELEVLTGEGVSVLDHDPSTSETSLLDVRWDPDGVHEGDPAPASLPTPAACVRLLDRGTLVETRVTAGSCSDR